MNRIAVVAVALSLLAVPLAPAAAATATDTTARVCCPAAGENQLENFGGYRFKGTVAPSRAGQIVRFSYKRPRADRWRPFKVAGPGGADGHGFYVLNRDRPRDRLSSDNRFSAYFTPSVDPGRWLLRAVFPAQDGYARSADIVRVEVSGSD